MAEEISHTRLGLYRAIVLDFLSRRSVAKAIIKFNIRCPCNVSIGLVLASAPTRGANPRPIVDGAGTFLRRRPGV